VVFVSSTIRDFEDWRRKLRDELLDYAEATCFLSEKWGGEYGDTVADCKARVLAANGFILLLGHWYGSVPDDPPGCEHSITHMEFDWAFERWKASTERPMLVLQPEPGSLPDRTLAQRALDILRGAKIDEPLHRQRLDAFHHSVTGTWRRVRSYRSVTEMQKFAIASCMKWKGGSPSAAAQGQVVVDAPRAPQVSDAELGELGRKPHLATVDLVLADLTGRADVPALALLVHGDRDAAQSAFLQCLIESRLARRWKPKGKPSGLPPGCNGAEMLASWVGQILGVPLAGAATPERLADAAALELKTRPLCFVLDRAGLYPGGVAAIRREFWLPFFVRLKAARASQRAPHRLLAVLSVYSADARAWQAESVPAAAGADAALLLALPVLGTVAPGHVLEWLEDRKVPDGPEVSHAQWVQRAMSEDGQTDDPLPAHVLNRLRDESLWPQGRDA
jgi:Domain of unknown function (DUF4062)